MKKSEENNIVVVNENKTANQEGGLMKKTKSELVQIILRKDAVEHRQTAELKLLQQSYNGTVETNNKLTHYKEETECELDKVYNKLKYYKLALGIAILALITAIIAAIC